MTGINHLANLIHWEISKIIIEIIIIKKTTQFLFGTSNHAFIIC